MLRQEGLSPKEFPIILTKDRIIGVLCTLFLLASAALVFCFGSYVGQKLYQPKVVTRYEVINVDRVVEKVIYTPVDRVIETVVYEPVEKIVYEQVEKPVIKEVEVSRPLVLFENLADLRQWLSNISVIEIGFNVVDQNNNSISQLDCDDYARRLQDKALQNGYIISFEVIRSAEYNSLFKEKKIPAGAIHAINSTIIGNEVYYIEPQTKEIVFVANLD
jgi:hypothetical protein